MKASGNSGYSDRTLPQKLGLKKGMKAISFSAPPEYTDWLGSAASILKSGVAPPWDFVHLFVNQISELENRLVQIAKEIKPDGMIWISWYKKSSKLTTEISEDILRDTCFPLGLVDIKVCSVSPDWTGLKFVIRKKLR
jgi:hypothetical protein